ncbi:WD40-repeat-containing domain protein [Trametes maxima]|nr:WD40-repeat-containing domain protein [Trametes maxima]
MSQPSYLQRLAALEKKISEFDDSEDSQALVQTLQRVAAVVRDAEKNNASDLAQIIDKAGGVLDSGTSWAYSAGDLHFLPSYAHSDEDPLIEDPSRGLSSAGYGTTLDFLTLIQSLGFFNGQPPFPGRAQRSALIPTPWTRSPQPHPKATRLARFYEGVTITATETAPLARTILQARCEVSARNEMCPVNAAIASDSSVLAIAGQGGYKNRDPILTFCYLDDRNRSASGDDDDDGEQVYEYGGFRSTTVDPRLSEVAFHIATDTPRRLAIVADSYRVKTFSWGGDVSFGDWTPTRGANVHTLDSGKYNGPLAVLPGGRIARSGKGGAAIWNLDTLQTHKGGRRVGKGKFNIEDSWRENDTGDDIELSVGSKPTTTITFAQADFVSSRWHFHEPTGKILSGEEGKNKERYGCYLIDLEDNGKKVVRFLGHGGGLSDFSTSAGDPNVFATACTDGYARLYDVRHPLPVMTFNAGHSSEFCPAVELVHPDGLPIIFTGGDRSQSVKAWDVRARASVYELATGNDGVHALAWDTERTTLYALAECDNVDRLGYHHNYRPARIPRWAELDPLEEDVNMDRDADEDDEDDEEYDSDDGDRYWPDDAQHGEDHFGYAYDAGDHVLLRYRFKEDPDPTVLPEYGDARPENEGFY